jgi:hypothetical protein
VGSSNGSSTIDDRQDDVGGVVGVSKYFNGRCGVSRGRLVAALVGTGDGDANAMAGTETLGRR